MRQPIFTRKLLTLIAVLSLQHVSPARATLAGGTAEKLATADKATQTDRKRRWNYTCFYDR